ncbi:MAG: hypothetical protein OXH46_10170 [Gemmatimonadetes bacterium]|nr:hypothetical protein [Gemmatimonadota bacterium]
MTRCRAILLVTIGLLVGMQPLLAQEAGDRVRVTTDASQVVGQIVAVRSDGFDLSMAGGGSGSFVHADILRLERSLGATSRWKEGLLYGGGGTFVTVTLGWGLAIVATCDAITGGTDTGGCARTPLRLLVAYGAVLGTAGGLLGMAVGSLLRGPERWEDVRVGGVAAGVSPILDLKLDRGRPAAVFGIRLRL